MLGYGQSHDTVNLGVVWSPVAVHKTQHLHVGTANDCWLCEHRHRSRDGLSSPSVLSLIPSCPFSAFCMDMSTCTDREVD